MCVCYSRFPGIQHSTVDSQPSLPNITLNNTLILYIYSCIILYYIYIYNIIYYIILYIILYQCVILRTQHRQRHWKQWKTLIKRRYQSLSTLPLQHQVQITSTLVVALHIHTPYVYVYGVCMMYYKYKLKPCCNTHHISALDLVSVYTI